MADQTDDRKAFPAKAKARARWVLRDATAYAAA
jgi:hypothetical protein